MKNHFIIPYAGNKREEVEKIYNSIKNKLDEIDYIIEPFCGTSAISYYISTLHPKKFKYILNDNNKFLIDLYNIIKDETKLNKLIETLKKYQTDIFSLDTVEKRKQKYKDIVKLNTHESYIIKNKIYAIKAGLYPIRDEERFKKLDFDKIKDSGIINFLKNEDITINNNDAIDIIEQYKNNKKCLIILDPPYLSCDNDFYENHNCNIYEYLYNNDIGKNKTNIILILEEIWIVELLFKKYKKETHNKLYQTNKKKTRHVIYKNF